MRTLQSPARHAFYIQTWITAPCTVPEGSLNFCLHEVRAVLLDRTAEMIALVLTPGFLFVCFWFLS